MKKVIRVESVVEGRQIAIEAIRSDNEEQDHALFQRLARIPAQCFSQEMEAHIAEYREATSHLKALASRIFEGYRPLIDADSDAFQEGYVRRMVEQVVVAGSVPVAISMICSGNCPGCLPVSLHWDIEDIDVVRAREATQASPE